MRKLWIILALLLCVGLVDAQNRRVIPRLQVDMELRIPVRNDCDDLTDQREGDLCFEKDVNYLYIYDGSSFVLPPANGLQVSSTVQIDTDSDGTVDYTIDPSGCGSADVLIYDGSGTFSCQTISGDISVTTGGVATIQSDSVALGTDTTGGYATSSSEGGVATSALALDSNGDGTNDLYWDDPGSVYQWVFDVGRDGTATGDWSLQLNNFTLEREVNTLLRTDGQWTLYADTDQDDVAGNSWVDLIPDTGSGNRFRFKENSLEFISTGDSAFGIKADGSVRFSADDDGDGTGTLIDFDSDGDGTAECGVSNTTFFCDGDGDGVNDLTYGAAKVLDAAVEMETGRLQLVPTATETCNVGNEGMLYYDSDDDGVYKCDGSSWVEIGSGGGGGAVSTTTKTIQARELIEANTLSTDTTTVTFSTISSAYDHLVLEMRAVSADANELDAVVLTFNNDTTDANYETVFVRESDGQDATYDVLEQENRVIGIINGATATGTPLSPLYWRLDGYSDTSEHKHGYSQSGSSRDYTGADKETQHRFLMWKSNSAVSEIDLTLDSGSDFASGSIFKLYGVYELDVVTEVTGSTGDGYLNLEPTDSPETCDSASVGYQYFDDSEDFMCVCIDNSGSPKYVRLDDGTDCL
jgi:hypothetical protein